jgi:hypothetical protein
MSTRLVATSPMKKDQTYLQVSIEKIECNDEDLKQRIGQAYIHLFVDDALADVGQFGDRTYRLAYRIP